MLKEKTLLSKLREEAKKNFPFMSNEDEHQIRLLRRAYVAGAINYAKEVEVFKRALNEIYNKLDWEDSDLGDTIYSLQAIAGKALNKEYV